MASYKILSKIVFINNRKDLKEEEEISSKVKETFYQY